MIGRGTQPWVWIVAAAIAGVGLTLGCGGSDGTAEKELARLQAIGDQAYLADDDEAFLMAQLDSENPEARSFAAWAAGRAVYPGALPKLREFVRNDADINVRANALEALAELGDDQVEALAVEALEGDDAVLRKAALRMLASPLYSGAVQAVAASLGAPEVEERELALSTMLAMNTPEAVLHIEPAIRDEESAVRSAAAFALGKMRQVGGIPLLAELLEQDSSWQVRANAAQSLGMIGDRSAATALKAALDDEDERVRTTAQNALDKLDS